jgi:uncharacterized membrane protein
MFGRQFSTDLISGKNISNKLLIHFIVVEKPLNSTIFTYLIGFFSSSTSYKNYLLSDLFLLSAWIADDFSSPFLLTNDISLWLLSSLMSLRNSLFGFFL